MTKHVFTRYISGPMRGKPNFNREQFASCEAALLAQFPDNRVINPAKNFGGQDDNLPVTQMLAVDFAQVIEADEIVLLPEWETSSGAPKEVELAKWLSKDFTLASFTTDEYGRIIGWSFDLVSEPPAVGDASPRSSALDEARDLICGDRNNAYGPPTQDFDRTAAMATAWGFSAHGKPLQGHHVAVFMILLKMSRLAWTPAKRDSWVDTAGYAGCGFECAVEEAS